MLPCKIVFLIRTAIASGSSRHEGPSCTNIFDPFGPIYSFPLFFSRKVLSAHQSWIHRFPLIRPFPFWASIPAHTHRSFPPSPRAPLFSTPPPSSRKNLNGPEFSSLRGPGPSLPPSFFPVPLNFSPPLRLTTFPPEARHSFRASDPWFFLSITGGVDPFRHLPPS